MIEEILELNNKVLLKLKKTAHHTDCMVIHEQIKVNEKYINHVKKSDDLHDVSKCPDCDGRGFTLDHCSCFTCGMSGKVHVC